jgi:hypothetical protein
LFVHVHRVISLLEQSGLSEYIAPYWSNVARRIDGADVYSCATIGELADPRTKTRNKTVV